MGKQITYDTRIVIERLWNSGKTYKEISQELGVSYSRIYHDIQMCGGQTDEAGRVIYSADKRQKILDTGRAWDRSRIDWHARNAKMLATRRRNAAERNRMR